MFRKACLVCESTALEEILNLGMHPFADTFIPLDRESEPDKLYPLIVDMCKTCKHIQTRAVTKPEDRYGEYDYSYTSSNSKTARNHWKQYAIDVLTYLDKNIVGVSGVSTVLEIGANDGYLCQQFQRHGCSVLGFDASEAMTKLAASRGIEVHHGIFGADTKLNEDFELIVANNVFNHSDDPIGFVKGVVEHLSSDGTFVFELPYWGTLVKDKKFDQIYHEHVSYFTVRSAVNLFTRFGLNVSHVEYVDYHGGSIRVFVNKGVCDDTVRHFLIQEDITNLFRVSTYTALREQIMTARDLFLCDLTGIRLQYPDARIICVGAAAKGNTFLNYYRLDSSLVDYVTDASDYKIGKLTPGTRIPIVGDDIFELIAEPYAIITSWNLSAVLREKLLAVNPKIVFLNPFDNEYAIHKD